MCPEVFQYNGPRPTTAVDMFSYGVLAWCALQLYDTPWWLLCQHELHPSPPKAVACKRLNALTARLAIKPAMRLCSGLLHGSSNMESMESTKASALSFHLAGYAWQGGHYWRAAAATLSVPTHHVRMPPRFF